MIYAPSPEKWRGIYNDVWKWRKTDTELDDILKKRLKKSTGREIAVGGRPPLDAGDKSWQDDFCEALLYPKEPSDRGNRYKASLVTPYSWNTILKMIQPGYTEFDKEFYEKVQACELQISAEVEAMMLNLSDPENYKDIESAKKAQSMAWTFSKILEKMDRLRWGKEMNVKHSGQIQHIHETLPKEKMLANLAEEQKYFIINSQKLLTATSAEPLQVIEAEFVESA